jgi:hypothetical protein
MTMQKSTSLRAVVTALLCVAVGANAQPQSAAVTAR